MTNQEFDASLKKHLTRVTKAGTTRYLVEYEIEYDDDGYCEGSAFLQTKNKKVIVKAFRKFLREVKATKYELYVYNKREFQLFSELWDPQIGRVL